MNLETSAERIRLMKAGLKGKQIEQLYVQKNNITIIGVNWQEK